MERGKRFVISDRNDYDAFYFMHEDRKDMSPQYTSIEDAMRFTEEEIKEIKQKFPERARAWIFRQIKFTI